MILFQSKTYPAIAAGALRALGRIAACGDVRMMTVAREQMERSNAVISMAAVQVYCRMLNNGSCLLFSQAWCLPLLSRMYDSLGGVTP